MTGAYLYISLLSSCGCFGAWIDHLDSFKNPNPWHSKVGFLKVVYYKHCIVHTDACDVGAGSYCEGDYFYCSWSVDLPAVQDSHINFKELAAVVLAAKKWGPLWANKPVVVLSDNSTTEACINRGSSHSVLLMKYLRHIFWLSVVFNFRLKAVHVLGEDNVLADRISQLHEPEARQYLTILLVLSPLSWHMSYNGFLYILDRSSVSGLAR